MSESTIGTHVARGERPVQRRQTTAYAQAIRRRSRARRVATVVVIAVVVAALAIGAGLMAFRSAVGGSLTLRNSDAADALVAVKSGEPSYALVSVELGSVAASLDNAGPDVFLLARLDPEAGSVALVNVPAGLQITIDNQSSSLSSIAASGDAALIDSFSTFAGIDISHFVKIASADEMADLVDALGGVEVDVPQKVDDPHAGNVVLSAGPQTLDGNAALTFLRATNLAYGQQDQLEDQLEFGRAVVASVFSAEGNFATRLEAIGGYVQTDLALSDLENMETWLGGVTSGDITTMVLPGYYMAVTDASGSSSGRYVSTSSDAAELVDALENSRQLSGGDYDEAATVSPSSFTVNIENGTTVEGAAAAAAAELKAAGFKVGDVGNAEQPVYGETLVVYKGSDARGLSYAKTLISSLGVGRAVDGDAYYSFDSDVLLIIGADNKPVS